MCLVNLVKYYIDKLCTIHNTATQLVICMVVHLSEVLVAAAMVLEFWTVAARPRGSSRGHWRVNSPECAGLKPSTALNCGVGG